jgi:hypothetical protein
MTAWWSLTERGLVKKSARLYVPFLQMTMNSPLCTRLCSQWYCMSILLVRLGSMVLVAMPCATLLSTRIYVGGLRIAEIGEGFAQPSGHLSGMECLRIFFCFADRGHYILNHWTAYHDRAVDLSGVSIAEICYSAGDGANMRSSAVGGIGLLGM